MPKRSRTPKDLNELARSIVAQATGEEDAVPAERENEETEHVKDPAAVALGRKGGLKGGKARAAKLTPEQRAEMARLAAEARWKKSK